MSENLRVAVIGGGTGGLCLAHGLAAAGVEVAVYERSRTRTERLQGYRLHINPHGSAALHECLPAPAWERFLATRGKGTGDFAFVTEQLRELAVIDEETGADPAAAHHSVSRISLHQVLSAGLDGILWYDKEFVRYETGPNGVTCFFADGTTAEADLVVGADGANSRVRALLLPHAGRVDTGITAVVGKYPLTAETRGLVPARLTAGPNFVLPPRGRAMFTAPHEFAGAEVNDETAAVDPVLFDNTGSYVTWAYGASARRLPDGLSELDGAGLRAVVLDQIRGWHPGLSRLVELSPEGTVSRLPIKTSVPVEPWETGPVTLLGDAVHSMTPFRGIGANTALRDAQLLCRNLIGANLIDAGEVRAAVADYEHRMRVYGFQAVRASARSAEDFVTENRFARAMSRSMFAVVGSIPALKRRMFAEHGES
ncbi:FAD-dependent oxidoreductase [Amycolatopsis sp. NBC_01480]|uniref:FAD-dependent oxidoreductase n=1 Tax=Amycolatopsis sp. NBC_01480 TaxID=2903562 RepID=UPI002E28A810|nr:NAD(P)/FAD-dependent oxidoreductase [Amycolatopsis sp. NBC_01480]